MELKNLHTKVTDFIRKNKYVVLIIVLGLVFMLIPSEPEKESSLSAETVPIQQPEASIEERLTEILGKIDGAGKVEVMLTVAKGEEIVYQTDNQATQDGEHQQQSTSTVIITDSNKKQSGLIRQKVTPTYLGAIVVCQGADDPNIRLAITEAVSKITGIKSNHISVLKMK